MRNRKGNALAEMALLIAIYTLIATAAVYLGNIGLVLIGAQSVVGIAATQPGEQGQADIEDQVPKFSVVTVTDFKDTVEEDEMFSAEDINQALEELARAPVGYYTYENGQIIYVLDEDRMSAFGRYIFDNNIQDESDEVAEIWEGWAYRTNATISCQYDPVFGDWDSIEVNEITSSSTVSGEQERGTHPGNDPDFNKEIAAMLHDEDFPKPLKAEPEFWLGSEIP